MLERYGVEHACQSEEIMNQIKEDNLKKYGVEYYMQTDEFKKKTKDSMLERYGVEHALQNEDIKKKVEQTNIERYGFITPLMNEDIKQKSRESCFEKYGVEYYVQTDEYKEQLAQTCIEKYGVDHMFKSEEVKEKIKSTNRERYGVDYPQQNPDIRNKILLSYMNHYYSDTEESKQELLDLQNKTKNTMLERYGVEHALQNEDIINTMKENNIKKWGYSCTLQNPEIKQKTLDNILKTFPSLEDYYAYIRECYCISRKKNKKHYGMTDIEYRTYLYLISLFSKDDIIYDSHIDDRYNFSVDFYIKSLDIFIEINGFWTHGKHLFNENDEEDINLLNKWKELSETKSIYQEAIKVWTIKDPLKIKVANENNLKFIPIWSNNIFEVIETIEHYFYENSIELPNVSYDYTEEEIFNIK